MMILGVVLGVIGNLVSGWNSEDERKNVCGFNVGNPLVIDFEANGCGPVRYPVPCGELLPCNHCIRPRGEGIGEYAVVVYLLNLLAKLRRCICVHIGSCNNKILSIVKKSSEAEISEVNAAFEKLSGEVSKDVGNFSMTVGNQWEEVSEKIRSAINNETEKVISMESERITSRISELASLEDREIIDFIRGRTNGLGQELRTWIKDVINGIFAKQLDIASILNKASKHSNIESKMVIEKLSNSVRNTKRDLIASIKNTENNGNNEIGKDMADELNKHIALIENLFDESTFCFHGYPGGPRCGDDAAPFKSCAHRHYCR